MTLRKAWIVLCVSLLSLAPALASLADMQTSVANVTGSTVTISVHNYSVQVETARIQVTVQLSDGSTQTVTSSKFAVGPGATASITLTAGSLISGIIDDPEPISAN
jgi:hypothetical protein